VLFRSTEPAFDPIVEPAILTEIETDIPLPESELAAFDISDLGELGSSGDVTGDITTATLSGSSASFFGVEARGSRFIYIVDTSGSMAQGRIAALKGALSNSIMALVDHSRFAVVRYSENAELLGEGWSQGNASGKSIALSRVLSLQAAGGTEPIGAFEIAFSLTPPPDAIYFMTDGQFAPDVENRIVSSIQRLMRRAGVRPTIHTISFVDKNSEKLLRRIARMTGGTYTHVPGLGP